MGIRGEITEAHKRHGARRARETGYWGDEDDFPTHSVPEPPPAPRPHIVRPHTLYEAEPWMARMGVRCGADAGKTKNP